MIRVFIGYDAAERVATSVLAHSINVHASEPVAITPVMLSQLRGVFDRPRNELQSTEFSFSRFLTPWLAGYEGWAVFMDCDMIMREDIAELWKLRDDRYAVQVVKHMHVPKEEKKFLGQVQTKYEKKNWSSVMLMNCAKCKALTPEFVNTATGLQLHQFKWLGDDGLIGALPAALEPPRGLRRARPESRPRALHDRRPLVQGVPVDASSPASGSPPAMRCSPRAAAQGAR